MSGTASSDLEDQIAQLAARLAVAESRLASRPNRLGSALRSLRDAVRDRQLNRAAVRRIGKILVDGPPHSGSRPHSVHLPAFELPAGPVVRPGLRVAVILDAFSELAFRYEWDQITFGPDDWREVLTARRPHLLFVESAWKGNNGRWRLHMTRDSRPSAELRDLVTWARQEGVPTVFWNKEDPPNYDRFIATARLFDQVFTVDGDRINDYRRDLGHDRVALLPFAAQPRIHNPVRRGAGRIYDVAFAGTYFAEKHPDRRAQMDYVLEPVRDLGLHIFSRMQGEDARYRFPDRYRDNIVGSLPYDQMLAAYTSYKLFLNVNSVTGSKTMCARRLFELSAAQTPVVSAPAASVEPFFGSDVEVVTDAEQTRLAVKALLGHEELRARRGLLAHRRVFDEHLFTHRVSAVLESVGIDFSQPARGVTVVVPTNRPEQLNHILSMVGRQSHAPVQLNLVLHGFDVQAAEVRRMAADAGVRDLQILRADSNLTLGECMNLGVEAADGDFVAKMDDDNLYGEHYLRDLLRAFDYTSAEVVGKWAHFTHLAESKANLLRFPDQEHRYTKLVQGGTIVTRTETARRLRFEPIPRRVDTTFLDKVRQEGGAVYSADRFNFVSVRRADVASHTWGITESELLAGKSQLVFFGDPQQHVEV